jgi:probable phosphoglycerate mutase
VTDQHPVAIRIFEEQRWDVIPGAEAAAPFAARVRAAVERIAAAHPDQRVAAFAHGGTIGEILHQTTDSRPFAFMGADNASISHIVVTEQRWILRRFNDTTHLQGAMTAAPEPLT